MIRIIAAEFTLRLSKLEVRLMASTVNVWGRKRQTMLIPHNLHWLCLQWEVCSRGWLLGTRGCLWKWSRRQIVPECWYCFEWNWRLQSDNPLYVLQKRKCSMPCMASQLLGSSAYGPVQFYYSLCRFPVQGSRTSGNWWALKWCYHWSSLWPPWKAVNYSALYSSF